MPEDSSNTRDALDSDTVELLRRHGVLRSLLASQITEELIETEPLDPEALQAAMRSYRQRNKLLSSDQVQAHCRRNGFSQNDLQRQACLPEWIRRSSMERFQSKAELHYLTRKEQFDQVTLFLYFNFNNN